MRAQNRQAGKGDQGFQAIQRALKHGQRYENVPSPELVDLVIRENIIYQMERVGRSPIVAAAIENGALLLIPCIYKLHTGEVEIMKEGMDESLGSVAEEDDILTIS